MPNVITIGKRKVGADQPVFVIAEIGMNHNGDWSLAEQMVRAAAATGVIPLRPASLRSAPRSISRCATAVWPRSAAR